MPELRRDPIIGRWVIIAKERGKRPSDFVVEREVTKGGFCPLCPGNEGSTPPEVLAYGRSGGGANAAGWSLRVVPNKFPALIIEGELDKRGEGIYDKMNGIGAHEVIVETPEHDLIPPEMGVHQIELIFKAYQERLEDLSRDARFRYIIIFKNQGAAAGASLEHSHSQLIALPIVPHRIQEELSGCQRYFEYKERCVFCDIIRQERSQNIRVVCENDHFVVICPFAPRSPFEMWVLPKRHSSSFLSLGEEMFGPLASLFLETLKRLYKAIPGVPYNYVLHTAPLRMQELEYYHWHIEIMPKLTKIAGFEWGSGFYINPTPPEEAGRFLRNMEVENG